MEKTIPAIDFENSKKQERERRANSWRKSDHQGEVSLVKGYCGIFIARILSSPEEKKQTSIDDNNGVCQKKE